MKKFLDEDFLLESKTSEFIYNQYAKNVPIFDFHCHLNPKEIAEDKKYSNITEVWLGGDHYKWRAIRSNGIDEKYVTGDSDDKEKFLKWAETMEYCFGNPLHHWAHLELRRFFNIYDILSPNNAEMIWDKCNEMLKKEEFSARNLIIKSNVKYLCTTDDPLDTLEYHKVLSKDDSFPVVVLPAFRPDKCINIEKDGFEDWVNKLGEIVGYKINSFDDLKSALNSRIEFFDNIGCKLSDHALDPLVYNRCSDNEANVIFKKAVYKMPLSNEEVQKYKTAVLLFLGSEYSKRNWVMQMHIGTLRNNNTRFMNSIGPDTGFDSIGDWNYADNLAKILDSMDTINELPKTILYCLNSRDNDVLATMIGCFQDSSVPGKLQFGSAWWFNDQKNGMEKHLTSLANLGLLRRFVGMVTDSRSFLSYTRHEYFRRILCNLIGKWAECGEIPYDEGIIKAMVEDICFNNIKKYLSI